jgi:hypothetical protein
MGLNLMNGAACPEKQGFQRGGGCCDDGVTVEIVAWDF